MCKYNIKYNILKQIKHLNLTLERLPFSFDINSFYKNEMVIKKKNRSGKRKREKARFTAVNFAGKWEIRGLLKHKININAIYKAISETF